MVDRIEQARPAAAGPLESGGMDPEFDLRHFRKVLAGGCRVIYRHVQSDRVEILAVMPRMQ
jgi:plasmid stabilization system protein ParE